MQEVFDRHNNGWLVKEKMNKSINILTVCQKGMCRSVGTRYRLWRMGYSSVIAIGARNTSNETLLMLCSWADVILLAHPRFKDIMPTDWQHKIDPRFTIGTDKWYSPQHPELQILLKQKLIDLGYK